MCKESNLLQKLMTLCSHHGYIYQSADLMRSGVKGCYDYGPMGSALRRNILNEWWTSVVLSEESMFGVDSSQLQTTHDTNSANNLAVEFNRSPLHDPTNQDTRLQETPKDESRTSAKMGEKVDCVLRNAYFQGTFSHYYNTLRLNNGRLPFGLAQLGRCFRRLHQSENTNRPDENKFIFDLPEFTQMTAQFYCSPKTADRCMIDWQRDRLQWWRKFSGAPSSFQMSETKQSDTLRTTDIQFHFPWGVDTIERISNRGGSDLEQLQHETGEDLQGRDGRKMVLPHVIEMVGGLERGMMALLLDAFQEKEKRDDLKRILRLHVKLAPVKAAVLPIRGTKELTELCEYLARELRKKSISCHRVGEVSPVISQHLTRFDEMGVPFVILLNENTLKTGVVRLRYRDTSVMQQLHITEVKECIERHLEAE
ncbi:DNA polymerase subunit gamma-2, mitochondrial-like [Asterias amurensis]|uniref:DNA polymerase subunit gamma-2, mitochondrial-like n=1 Tax=Asterias amurensis TaxID=7602 RepID=UPI003AB684C6